MRKVEVNVSIAGRKFWVKTPNNRSVLFQFDMDQVNECLAKLELSVTRVARHAHEWQKYHDHPKSKGVIQDLVFAA